ncbi:unnamed protein product [Sphagnum balticum]
MHTNRATPTSDAPSFLPLPPHTDDPEHQNLFVLLAILQSAPPTAKNQSGVVLLLSSMEKQTTLYFAGSALQDRHCDAPRSGPKFNIPTFYGYVETLL